MDCTIRHHPSRSLILYVAGGVRGSVGGIWAIDILQLSATILLHGYLSLIFYLLSFLFFPSFPSSSLLSPILSSSPLYCLLNSPTLLSFLLSYSPSVPYALTSLVFTSLSSPLIPHCDILFFTIIQVHWRMSSQCCT